MAHSQQIDFCKSIKQLYPYFFQWKIVVDIGSLDINGSNRYLFEECLYIGIDLKPGRNVDFACKGHEFNLPDNSIDVTISTECFEHDPFFHLTLNNMVRMVKPGGLLIFSCATTGRPEHGTRRTTPNDAPFIQDLDEWANYYKNLDENDIRNVVNVEEIFSNYGFSTNYETNDLYFWGIKKGDFVTRNDYSFIESGKTAVRNQAALINALAASQDKAEHVKNEFENLLNNLKEELLEVQTINEVHIRDKFSLTQSIHAKQALLDAIKNENSAYSLELCRLQESINYLNIKIEENKQDLHNLYVSRSWRISSPLRYFGKIIRKIKR